MNMNSNNNNNIGLSRINVAPTASDGGSNFHDEHSLQFCKLLENVDALQFSSMVDNLPLTRPDAVLSSTAPPKPECALSACTFPEINLKPLLTNAPKQQEEEEHEQHQHRQCRFKPFHEERWDHKLLELRAFRKRHGHCLVPHTYPPNPQLARWVKRQRRQYKLLQDGKASTMTPDRVEILRQDGFVWDSHEAAWREKVEDLRQYRAKHGHCLVPSNYEENPQLATWVKCQRRQHKLYWANKPSAMNTTRIAELESEGFCWELRNTNARGGAPMKRVNGNNDVMDQSEMMLFSDISLNRNELKVLNDIISLL